MRALVTGAAGQDGVLLTRLLQSHGTEVIGVDQVEIGSEGSRALAVDVTDPVALTKLVREVAPDEIYHLAACHHSSEESGGVFLDHRMVATNFLSTETIVATISRWLPDCRLLFAASSQMFTPSGRMLVSERTPMQPATFYGHTKAWSRELLSYYREHRGVFCASAILFNHESPLRQPRFLTRKVSLAAARARVTGSCNLHIRDLSAEVDWSSARDVVAGMRLALTAEMPEDFVVASGAAHSVTDLLEAAFGSVGLRWEDFTTWEPGTAESRGTLIGDPSRLESVTGWSPSVGFAAMIEEMVEEDIARLRTHSRATSGDDA